MRSSLHEGPEDWVWDAVAPVRCHACESDPIGPNALRSHAKPYPPNVTIQIGRKEVRLCEYHAQALVSMLNKELDATYAKRGSDYECCCPVCGKQNERQTFYENGIGTVEVHYFCSDCGYAEEMAYSPCYTTFVKGGKLTDRFKRWKTRLKHWKKALRIKLGDDFSSELGKHI